MRAVFRVSIGGADVTPNFFFGGQSLVHSITVNDQAGNEADTATIVLDDTDGMIAMPAVGDDVEIALGWEEDGPVVCFEGFVDDVTSTGGRGQGRILTIECKSADMRDKAKQPDMKHAEDATFEDAAQKFAADAKLTLEIDPALAAIKRPWWGMMNESFLAWGARTAKELGATFKVVGERGIFVPRNEGKSPKGEALPVIAAQWGVNLISWTISPALGRPQFKTYEIRYYDADLAKWVTEVVEGRETEVPAALAGRFTEADADAAKRRADSLKREGEREEADGTIIIDGNPEATAEGKITLAGARPGIDGTYTIDSARHDYSRSGGYVTTCSVKLPDGDAGKDKRATSASAPAQSSAGASQYWGGEGY